MNTTINWGPWEPGKDMFGRPLRFNVVNDETGEEVACYALREDAEQAAAFRFDREGVVHTVIKMGDSMTKDDIRALRIRLNLTQMEFAYRLGVTVDAVRKWEQGRRTPGPRTTSLLEALSASQTQSEGTVA